jgi:hypothetical protein
MDARYLTASLLATVLLAGCQSGGNTELMERELRLQEDRIYHLEDELARCCQAMQARQEGEIQQTAPAPSRRPTPPSPSVPTGPLPAVELEMPAIPGPAPTPVPPVNETPSLFQRPRPPSGGEPGTALRIVKPAASPPRLADANPPSIESPPDQPRPPVRMRFASAADEWSTAAAPDRQRSALPRPAAGDAPRRPQWSPYR